PVRDPVHGKNPAPRLPSPQRGEGGAAAPDDLSNAIEGGPSACAGSLATAALGFCRQSPVKEARTRKDDMADIVDTRTDAETALARACETLHRGVPVAIPTETVYGLAADATNPLAITRIYEMKGRPRFNPLICHMADLAMAEEHAVFDPVSRAIAEAFWPGPLTLVLPIRPESTIHPLARAGLDTIGIRVPRGFASRLLSAFGQPLAAPS